MASPQFPDDDDDFQIQIGEPVVRTVTVVEEAVPSIEAIVHETRHTDKVANSIEDREVNLSTANVQPLPAGQIQRQHDNDADEHEHEEDEVQEMREAANHVASDNEDDDENDDDEVAKGGRIAKLEAMTAMRPIPVMLGKSYTKTLFESQMRSRTAAANELKFAYINESGTTYKLYVKTPDKKFKRDTRVPPSLQNVITETFFSDTNGSLEGFIVFKKPGYSLQHWASDCDLYVSDIHNQFTTGKNTDCDYFSTDSDVSGPVRKKFPRVVPHHFTATYERSAAERSTLVVDKVSVLNLDTATEDRRHNLRSFLADMRSEYMKRNNIAHGYQCRLTFHGYILVQSGASWTDADAKGIIILQKVIRDSDADVIDDLEVASDAEPLLDWPVHMRADAFRYEHLAPQVSTLTLEYLNESKQPSRFRMQALQEITKPNRGNRDKHFRGFFTAHLQLLREGWPKAGLVLTDTTVDSTTSLSESETIQGLRANAAKYNPAEISVYKPSHTWYASVKEDGYRFHYNGQYMYMRGCDWSRCQKKMPPDAFVSVVAQLARSLNTKEPLKLDGEVSSVRRGERDLMDDHMTDPAWTNLRFKVFDVIVTNKPFRERLQILMQLKKKIEENPAWSRIVKVLHHEELVGEKAVVDFCESNRDKRNREGYMLRHSEGLYLLPENTEFDAVFNRVNALKISRENPDTDENCILRCLIATHFGFRSKKRLADDEAARLQKLFDELFSKSQHTPLTLRDELEAFFFNQVGTTEYFQTRDNIWGNVIKKRSDGTTKTRKGWIPRNEPLTIGQFRSINYARIPTMWEIHQLLFDRTSRSGKRSNALLKYKYNEECTAEVLFYASPQNPCEQDAGEGVYYNVWKEVFPSHFFTRTFFVNHVPSGSTIANTEYLYQVMSGVIHENNLCMNMTRNIPIKYVRNKSNVDSSDRDRFPLIYNFTQFDWRKYLARPAEQVIDEDPVRLMLKVKMRENSVAMDMANYRLPPLPRSRPTKKDGVMTEEAFREYLLRRRGNSLITSSASARLRYSQKTIDVWIKFFEEKRKSDTTTGWETCVSAFIVRPMQLLPFVVLQKFLSYKSFQHARAFIHYTSILIANLCDQLPPLKQQPLRQQEHRHTLVMSSDLQANAEANVRQYLSQYLQPVFRLVSPAFKNRVNLQCNPRFWPLKYQLMAVFSDASTLLRVERLDQHKPSTDECSNSLKDMRERMMGITHNFCQYELRRKQVLMEYRDTTSQSERDKCIDTAMDECRESYLAMTALKDIAKKNSAAKITKQYTAYITAIADVLADQATLNRLRKSPSLPDVRLDSTSTSLGATRAQYPDAWFTSTQTTSAPLQTPPPPILDPDEALIMPADTKRKRNKRSNSRGIRFESDSESESDQASKAVITRKKLQTIGRHKGVTPSRNIFDRSPPPPPKSEDDDDEVVVVEPPTRLKQPSQQHTIKQTTTAASAAAAAAVVTTTTTHTSPRKEQPQVATAAHSPPTPPTGEDEDEDKDDDDDEAGVFVPPTDLQHRTNRQTKKKTASDRRRDTKEAAAAAVVVAATTSSPAPYQATAEAEAEQEQYNEEELFGYTYSAPDLKEHTAIEAADEDDDDESLSQLPFAYSPPDAAPQKSTAAAAAAAYEDSDDDSLNLAYSPDLVEPMPAPATAPAPTPTKNTKKKITDGEDPVESAFNDIMDIIDGK